MGEIVGAAIVSHHPGLMQPEEVRVQRGAGRDSDLVAGFDRVRAKLDEVEPDTLVIFDTHWFTTSLYLVTGAAHYAGSFISSELPFAIAGVSYDYDGAPDLAATVEDVAKERGVKARNADQPDLPLYYATINLVNKLRRDEKVMSVSTCQNSSPAGYLRMGEVIGEAVRRAEGRVALLASGALSHDFNDIDAPQKNPCLWDPENVSSEANRKLDEEVIGLLGEGRHDVVLDRYPELRKARYEGFGSHYIELAGALGGRDCRAKGTPLSKYENAGGTGNIHIWFDL